MGSSPTEPKLRRPHARSLPAKPRYCGPAVITDGVIEDVHDVEIHATIAARAATAAWHVIIKGRLVHDLRFPSGKAVAVQLPSGVRAVGRLVDPQLIKGEGLPPC